ncbi:MAG TPA: hypothetical protein VN903_39745 [Polyangia bacterium]|jgi:hypothetical protein|nr:hypothetical protein [Polyangia bacterium]
MTRKRIEHFFAVLAHELQRPARAYVTGAAAAALWGRVRPSVDVDLGIELVSRSADRVQTWQAIETAMERTKRLTGIPANFAEDIDRWGMITLLDYRRTSRRYRRFEQLDVRLLHPTNWSIGKLTRFLDSDIRDVTEVFRAQKIQPAAAARIWGRALRASPASTTQFQFRRNVEHFFAHQGPAIWGRTFDPASAVRAFERAASRPGAKARDRGD